MPGCAICGVSKANLQQHIKKHGLTGKQYKAQYPGAEIVDAAVRTRRGNAYKETCQAKYGTNSVSQVKEIQEQATESRKQTNTKKLEGSEVAVIYRNGREVRVRKKQYICEQCGKRFSAIEDVRKYCSQQCVADAKQGLRESEVDHDFFDDIRTEEQAYCLGFIIGDGHIVDERVGRYRIQIEQANKDVDVLESIRRAMGIANLVRLSSDPSKSVLVFHSKQIWLRFHQWGLTGNKTTTAQVPQVVKPELVSHLIRGMFDADGWITLTKKSPGIGYGKGSRHLAEYVRLWCNQVCGKDNKLGFRPNTYHTDSNYHVGYGGRTAAKITNQLYEGANIFMQRKYQRHLRLKERCPIVNGSGTLAKETEKGGDES